MITRSNKRRCGKDINFSPGKVMIVDAGLKAMRNKLSAIDSLGGSVSDGLHAVFPPILFSKSMLFLPRYINFLPVLMQ
jgi:hypothetical protein